MGEVSPFSPSIASQDCDRLKIDVKSWGKTEDSASVIGAGVDETIIGNIAHIAISIAGRAEKVPTGTVSIEVRIRSNCHI